MTDQDTAGTPREDEYSPSRLWGVWPTDLRKEWRARTRYGKLLFVVMLPSYVAGWAIILGLVALMALGYYGLVAVWRIGLWLDQLWPETHRSDGDA